MKMFLLGMLALYIVLCIATTITEICANSDWVLHFLAFPTIAIWFIWVKVIHYGKVQVYSEEKGWHWKKKKRGGRQ